ncbi:transporter substrate-binding domain-containing protein [Duganella fentianensis]|uniref:substrate-binding periplasmic protein n=1 Tax=Duganella fentianensis TaxID=2692177 RepID=UPI0032B10EF3
MQIRSCRTAITTATLFFLLAGRSAAASSEVAVYLPGEPDAQGRPTHSQPTAPRIIDLVASKSGLPLVAHPLPWRRALFMTETGQGILYGAEATPERLRKFEFSASLGYANQWLLSTEQAPLVFRQWNDLRNKKISIMSGASYGAEFEQRRNSLFKVEQNATNMASQIKMLRAGRVDAIIVTSLLNPQHLEDKLNCLFPGVGRLLIRGKPIEANPITFAIAKDTPLISKLPALNSAIEQIVRNHKLQPLFNAPPSTACAPHS